MTEKTTETLRAYRFCLDLSPREADTMARFAGASRWAFNWALAQKVNSHNAYRDRVQALRDEGATADEAKAKVRQESEAARAELNDTETQRKALFRAVKGQPKDATELITQRQEQLADEYTTAQQELADARARGATPAQLGPLERKAAALVQESEGLRRATESLPTKDHADLRKQLARLRSRVAQLQAERFTSGYEVPSGPAFGSLWRGIRDLPREDGGSPWHAEVSVYCFSHGFSKADAAWSNWLSSHTGKRAGRRVGYPRFKKKGKARDSFTLFHDVKKPSIRPESGGINRHHTAKTTGVLLEGYRGLVLPRIGQLRTHDSTKRLVRLVRAGRATVQSVTVARHGDRWYASVLCKVQQHIPEKPTRRQSENGTVGVKWTANNITLHTQNGVETLPQPRWLRRSERTLAARQRKASKAQLGSANRARANAAVAKLHRQIAEARKGWLHQTTARLTKTYARVAFEDLDVSAMTRSQEPKGKSRHRNRAVLDASPGELRRQITYKGPWYGSDLALTERGMPTTRTCANCGEQNSSSPPPGQVFHCDNCGTSAPREANAAAVIAKYATVKIQESAAADGVEALE